MRAAPRAVRRCPASLLVAADGQPVIGVDAATYSGDILHNGALVSGNFPGRVELRVDGDVCATSWQIRLRDGTGSVMSENIQENPGENPFSIAQNRIDLPYLVLGHSIVSATVNFGRNRVARGERGS